MKLIKISLIILFITLRCCLSQKYPSHATVHQQSLLGFSNDKYEAQQHDTSTNLHTNINPDATDSNFHLDAAASNIHPHAAASNNLPDAAASNIQPDAAATNAYPCPEALDIAPCTCYYDGTNLHLECTEVQSEEQLAAVFQSEFPVKEFYEFRMASNQGIKILGNVLNGVTFERVELNPGPFAIQMVSEYFLLDSVSTLTYLYIADSQVIADSFPFHTLSSYTNMYFFALDSHSQLTWLPPIVGQSFETIGFGISNITDIQPGTFTFKDPLNHINLAENVITTIAPGAFVVDSVNPPAEDRVFLRLNQNLLTLLEEEVFGQIFPYISELRIYDNPLECGCDIAWLVLDPTFMAKVDTTATCADGTNLHDLDPDTYLNLCRA